MLSRHELCTVLSAATTFVCPSIYEPLGIVNLEAMACGAAVVGTATGGIPEVVVDGVTGRLVPIEQVQDGTGTPLDPDRYVADLARVLTEVVSDPRTAAAYGAAGRERATKDFSWGSIATRTLAHIGGIKLGLEFFCAHGQHGVREMAELGLPIFLDLKLHDIPNTVAKAVQALGPIASSAAMALVACWHISVQHELLHGHPTRSRVLNRLLEHTLLTLVAMLFAMALGLPLAVWLGHRRRFGTLAVNVSNIGRAIPSFGIVAIMLPISLWLGLGIGFWPTFVALVALAMPPIFTNTYTAVAEVDPAIREAALGMGMTGAQLLFRTELPLAMPVIWTALRVSSV